MAKIAWTLETDGLDKKQVIRFLKRLPEDFDAVMGVGHDSETGEIIGRVKINDVTLYFPAPELGKHETMPTHLEEVALLVTQAKLLNLYQEAGFDVQWWQETLH